MPDVRGLTATEASSRLVGEGFSVNQVERADDSKVGLVVDMDPKPGTRQDTRTSITLYVGVASQNSSSPGGSDGQGS